MTSWEHKHRDGCCLGRIELDSSAQLTSSSVGLFEWKALLNEVPHKPERPRRSRPFLGTDFGRLPPEIREKIFQALLVFSPRLPGETYTQAFINLMASNTQVLQTCRSISSEAYPVFYASGLFYFDGAQELLAFLQSVPKEYREEIRALRLANLGKVEPTCTPKQLRVLRDTEPDPDHYRELANSHVYKMHASTLQAFRTMSQCKGLRRIYLDMKNGQEAIHLRLVTVLASMRGQFVRIVPWGTQWVVGSNFLTAYDTEADKEDYKTEQLLAAQAIQDDGEHYQLRLIEGRIEDLDHVWIQIDVDLAV